MGNFETPKELRSKTLKYVPAYEIEKRWLARVKEMEECSAILAKSEIILAMLSKEMSFEDVTELTGTGVEKIEMWKASINELNSNATRSMMLNIHLSAKPENRT